MRLAVFSDIHGNAEALSLALADMTSHAPDEYIFLGDLCGYYYEQLAAWHELMALDRFRAVLGNHDRIFLQILGGDEALRSSYRSRYGLSMDLLLEQDHGRLSEWLRGLPEAITDERLRLIACHGSPASPIDGYIYPDSAVGGVYPLGWTLLLGHTHYRMDRQSAGARLINPGSVGQPRDGGPPSWCLLDTESGCASFHTVRFDVSGLRAQVRARGETNPYLQQVLLRQRNSD